MKFTGLLFACLLSLCCSAQDMTTVFGNMPKDMILLVDSIQRQDLMDLYKDGKTAAVKSKLNEMTTINSFNDDFLDLKSGNSSIQIALLNLVNNSKVVCFIQTVCAPVCDSQLKFFTHNWELLETSDFIQLEDFSWFIKDETDKNNENFINATKSLDMILMQYSFNPENMSLTQTFTTPLYLNKDDKESLEPFLKKEPKVFEWKKMRFQ